MVDPPERRRQHVGLVGLLTFASGCVDVVTLMVIGGSFTSVITGNLIFIGRAVGTSSLSAALHAIMAVAGYVVGVAIGSRLRWVLSRRAAPAPWPRSATLVIAVEWSILAAINIVWISYGAAPPAAATDVLLICAALALGMQGAAARAITGSPSTTYMTGALTTLIEALSTQGRRAVDPAALVGLLCLVAGAACSALLVAHASRAALLPPLVAVALVIVVKLRDHRDEQRANGTVTGRPDQLRSQAEGKAVACGMFWRCHTRRS
jgi:uncharacterized membrane protein YoaK (UPF0700 family)